MTYTTANLVQAELRATTAFSGSTNPTSSTINNWIDETSDYIDSLSGQSWRKQSYTEYFDFTGAVEFFIKTTPLISITSFSYNENAEGEAPSYVALTENVDYVVYNDLGMIKINLNKFQPKLGKSKGLQVVYIAGYANPPARVQMLATKMVAQRTLSSLMNDNLETRNAGGSISVGSINIVEPADYGVNTFKQLGEDIGVLSKEITNSGFRVHRYG